ncbi:MAG: HD domain-containing protein [Lachnospiraceae bacterium]|nr:HD domain-containing protein [Lachnospiraceae bacterium]
MGNKSLRHNIGMIIFCIIINILGKTIAAGFNLPIWFDMVGTCVAAYFTGPIGAVISGAAGNLIYALVMHQNWVYMFVNAAVGVLLYICVKRGYLDKLETAIMSSFLVGIIAVVLSVPINLYFNGGKCGNFWGDVFFDMLEWHGSGKTLCSLGGEAIVDIIDKPVCVAVSYIVIKFILKYKNIKKEWHNNIAKTLTAFVLVPTLLAGFLTVDIRAAGLGNEVPERNFDENYVETIYDSRTGMPYSEANTIAETADGYIWIGGYAGLTKYNGKEFEFVSGITGVYALMTDSRGRLWISTNDSGIVVYENGVFNSFSAEDGLPANSTRAMTEAPDGSVYIGTTSSLCKVRVEGNEITDIVTISDGVEYASSLAMYGDKLVGVTNAGDIFVLDNDSLLYAVEPRLENTYYTCVSAVGERLLVGTSESYVEELRIFKNMSVTSRRVELGGFVNIRDIKRCSDGRVWICADNGVGYLKESEDDGWNFYTQHYEGFDASILNIHEDYEGNIWFASQRCGVMKLSKGKFLDLFSLSGIDAVGVNAVCVHEGYYYCGTDNGLVIIKEGSYGQIENEITDLLQGVRIRSIMKDPEGTLWFCTYGKTGLVSVNKKGYINSLNSNRGATDDRFRCMTELSDGTIAVGTSDGINFVDDDHVIGTVTREDGLENSQILSLCEGPDGNLYASTDGAGIYVVKNNNTIKNNKIVKNIGIEDGLTADVVLRLVPYQNGFFVVASNALCYMENDVVTHLDSFPYYDNFDILIEGDNAYVLTSAGIYRVDAQALKTNDVTTYKLFNYNDGLAQSITSNAWNFVGEDGRIFFCGNKGVGCFDPNKVTEEERNYKFGISVTLSDGEVLNEENGIFTIPANVKTFTVKAAIRKYSLSDVSTKFFIDGISDGNNVVSSYDLEPIQITNLGHGGYPVHIQILNEEGTQVLQEEEYLLRKEAHVWENAWYILYLVVVCIWVITFVMWMGFTLANIFRRRRQLEMLRKELENKVNIQTEEIRDQAEKMETFQWEVIEGMASLIESRDGNTGDHVKNVSKYVAIIAQEMLRMHLYSNIVTPKYVDIITKVSPLHDVGKIKISDVILNKPGKFTPEEYEIMKNHAAYGGMIVEDILGKNATPEMKQIAKDVAYYHHEKWDGSGYPEGKAGDDIPLAARIMAVADVFDALVSKRVYKDAFEMDKAFDIIKEEAGKHFDAEIVRVFLKKKDVIVKELKHHEA